MPHHTAGRSGARRRHLGTRRLPHVSDDALLALVRQGDSAAFADLYQRHHHAALRYANRLARRHLGHDGGEDILSEGVRKVLSALRRGQGPRIGFRQYLFTAIRSVAFTSWAPSRREVTIDEIPETELAMTDSLVDGTFAMTAFDSLPAREQRVLWSSEVNDMPPREIAPLVGTTPHNVSMITLRARDALRIAFVRAHVAPPSHPDCDDAVGLLAKRTTTALADGPARRLDRHLAGCAECRRAEAEISHQAASWPWASTYRNQ